MNEKVTFRVVIPWDDQSNLARRARYFNGHKVNVISKYTGDPISLNKSLVPEAPLLRSLDNSQYFLGKKDWLQDISMSQRQYVNPHSDIGNYNPGGEVVIHAGIGGTAQPQSGYSSANYSPNPPTPNPPTPIQSGYSSANYSPNPPTPIQGYSGLGFAENPLFQCSGMQGWTGLAPRYTKPPITSQATMTKKELGPKKAAFHQQKMQKLKYQHLKHANQCVVDKYRLETQKIQEQQQVELEKHKADSREKIAIQTAKYAMIETFVRCAAVVSTLASAMYFLT